MRSAKKRAASPSVAESPTQLIGAFEEMSPAPKRQCHLRAGRALIGVDLVK